MTRDEVEKRVTEVTARVLKTDPARITPTSRFAQDLGAESIQSIELVAAFEEAFNIEMDEDEALAVTSVGAAVDFIAKVVKEQHG